MTDPLERTLNEDVELQRQAMLAREPRLTAVRTGSMTDTLANVLAMLLRDAKRHALREVAKLFFHTAEGLDLDALADDRRGLSRHAASPAVGALRLTRSSSGSVTIPEGAVFTDPDGGQYLSISETIWSDGEAAVDVDVQSGASGVGANRVSGLSFTCSESWASGITDLVVTNPSTIDGGNAEEADSEFLRRIEAWWGVQQRATAAALQYAALLDPSVRRATVDLTHITPAAGGYVSVYVTDGSDGYNTALGNRVKARINDWRAAGVVVNVYGADVVNQAIEVSFDQKAGGPPDATAKAVAAILSYVNGLAIGSPLRRSRIAAVALDADASLLNCDVITPAADIVPAAGQVIRCPESSITVS